MKLYFRYDIDQSEGSDLRWVGLNAENEADFRCWICTHDVEAGTRCPSIRRRENSNISLVQVVRICVLSHICDSAQICVDMYIDGLKFVPIFVSKHKFEPNHKFKTKHKYDMNPTIVADSRMFQANSLESKSKFEFSHRQMDGQRMPTRRV